MQFILDHMSSLLIGAVVMLIALSTQLRGSEAMMEQSRYFAAKQHIAEFTEMITTDFENIGLGVPTGTAAITSATDSTITFQRLMTIDAVTLVTVAYQITPADTVEVEGEAMSLFSVERWEDGVKTGSSPPRMNTFVIELQTAAGAVVTDPSLAEAVHVRLTLVPPFTEEGYLNQVYWERTFYPGNL